MLRVIDAASRLERRQFLGIERPIQVRKSSLRSDDLQELIDTRARGSVEVKFRY